MNSNWYAIAQAVAAQVRAVATAQSVGFLDNPGLPLDVAGKGGRVLFVLLRGDKLIEGPGQRREKRRMRVVVGALADTATALADADRLHFAARDALKAEATRTALGAASALGSLPREVEIEPELKDVASQGTVLLSAYEIDYFQTYPNAA